MEHACRNATSSCEGGLFTADLPDWNGRRDEIRKLARPGLRGAQDGKMGQLLLPFNKFHRECDGFHPRLVAGVGQAGRRSIRPIRRIKDSWNPRRA